VGVAAACAALGFPRSSFYHAQRPAPVPDPADPPRARTRPRPAHALSPAEQHHIRDLLNSDRFVDCAPRTIYATLLDDGEVHCSWSTMYRLLRQDAATRERRRQRRHPRYTAPELLATGPRQVWSWDITKLRGPLPGIWYHLSVILDIFSRKIVGWRAELREDAELAEAMMAETYVREGVQPHQLTLHADRGAAMTANTMAELLRDLGVTQSHSRPTISDDNPYSESPFKTMKYGPTYPDRFANLADARGWMRTFVRWYNHQHRHSGIAFLTPDVVHRGLAEAVLDARQATLNQAYAAHPERYPRGCPQVGRLPSQVGINLPRPPRDPAVPSAPPADEDPSEDPCHPHRSDQNPPSVPTGTTVGSAPAGSSSVPVRMAAENQPASPRDGG